MKKTLYLYVLDMMADWEVGYILQALSMQQMCSSQTLHYSIKTIAHTKEPITTLGGLNILPDYAFQELNEDEMVALLLPGANTWEDTIHQALLEKIPPYIEKGTLVAAICGATVALADLGILNHHHHTSNALEYLEGFSKHYKGHTLYQSELSVRDHNVITASSAGGLLWAKHILEYLNVYSHVTLEAWYQYYLTGDPKYYMTLVSSIEYIHQSLKVNF